MIDPPFEAQCHLLPLLPEVLLNALVLVVLQLLEQLPKVNFTGWVVDESFDDFHHISRNRFLVFTLPFLLAKLKQSSQKHIRS